MSNTLVTPQLFTKLTLMNLGGYLSVAKNMSKDYSSEFGKKTQKIGDTLYVRRPQRFAVTDGLGYQPQPISNTQTAITVDQVKGVHFEWDSIERTLSLNELNELYAKPAALALASTINNLAATYIGQNTANLVGTPGSAPTTLLTYMSAADKLIALGLPEQEELSAIISRKMGSTFVNAVSTVMNPAATIGGQYKRGTIDPSSLGYKWFTDQTLWRQTYGTYSGTPLTGSSVVSTTQTADGGDNATMSLVTDGWGSNVSGLNKGDVFTIAGTYAVHPQTKVSTGELKQFTVVNTVTDTSGDMTIVIYPAITPVSVNAQYANVSAGAANNSPIVVAGTTGVVSEQGLVMHKNAFAFLSVPLANPKEGAVEMVSEVTDPDTGVSLSFIRDFDTRTRQHINRFDCLFGFGKLYPEMACRVASS